MDTAQKREAWNKGKMIGQKPPLKPKDIWAIRIHLQNKHAVRDLAMFNLAIDSKLRGCDLVSLRVRDVTHGSQILPRAIVIQRKTQRPVQFELTEPTRLAVSAWLEKAHLRGDQYLFPSRLVDSPSQQIAKVVTWLKQHYTEDFLIDDLAAKAHMSPSTFRQHFRAVTGVSPLKYLKNLRLQDARQLMLNEDLDASSAAVRVGYESASQFSREYTRLFGEPPLRDIKRIQATL
jgi:AraC-like DNA-binding protein